MTRSLLVVAVVLYCSTMVGQDEPAPRYGACMQRTMTLLATSMKPRRNPVKIVFYGQSIMAADGVRKRVAAELKKRYPDAELTVENRAISGFQAHLLVRTAEHDLYPSGADLVVFHVYGGEAGWELERIILNLRKRTTAEIMLWTHHLGAWGGQHPEDMENASKWRHLLARKYGCELVEVNRAWTAYLAENDVPRGALLRDDVHLNARGERLLGDIVMKHFRYDPTIRAPWVGRIRTYEARRALHDEADEIVYTGRAWADRGDGTVGADPDTSLELTFEGTRVDVVSFNLPGKEKLGSARITIDGKPVSAHPGAWMATRPSNLPGGWYPALLRVGLGKDVQAETWTLSFSNVSGDGKRFDFSLAGSETGPDGTGSHRQQGEWTSRSGRIRIDPKDFMLAADMKGVARPLPGRFDITWTTRLRGLDRWQPVRRAEAGVVNRTTLVAGLDNARHTLVITPEGNGAVPVKELVVHRPPLK
ncbi:MAG: SGNH/GDSL hydrolase family protein [Planctomycetota bacterium]